MATVLSTAEEVDRRVLNAPFDLIPLFAYGTLRPGEALDSIVNVESHQQGKVYGYNLYHHPLMVNGYPWMVAEKHGIVVGDLLWVHRDQALRHTALMEMRAGYNVEFVNVYTDDMDEAVPAACFVSPRRPHGTVRIDTGNWKVRA